MASRIFDNDFLTGLTNEELINFSEAMKKEIERRKKDKIRSTLLEFEQGFKKYKELDPDFIYTTVGVYGECAECGETKVEVEVVQVLKKFFEEEKRRLEAVLKVE